MITNSVVILFICDLDELLYAILMAFSCWVKSMLLVEHSNCNGDFVLSYHDSLEEIHGVNAKLEGKAASLEEDVRRLSQNMKLLLEPPGT